MSDFFSIQSLLTYAGASTAVGALTQILKPLLSKLPYKISWRVVSYALALIVLLAATLITGGKSASDLLICFVNAALVALSSNGGYDLITDIIGDDAEDNDDNNT